MKLKFKNILLISLLAVAGIFSATAVAFNKQVNEQPVAEKAEAAVNAPSTIWLGGHSYWTGDDQKIAVWVSGGTDTGNGKLYNAQYDSGTGLYFFPIYDQTSTNISFLRLKTNSSSTYADGSTTWPSVWKQIDTSFNTSKNWFNLSNYDNGSWSSTYGGYYVIGNNSFGSWNYQSANLLLSYGGNIGALRGFTVSTASSFKITWCDGTSPSWGGSVTFGKGSLDNEYPKTVLDGNDNIDLAYAATYDFYLTTSHKISIVKHLTITLDPTDGSVTPTSWPVTVSYKNASGNKYAPNGDLPTPTRTGYSGTWYTSASGGSPVTSNTSTESLTIDTTIYAQWTINNYDIYIRPVLDGVRQNHFESSGLKISCSGPHTFSEYESAPTWTNFIYGYSFEGFYSTLSDGKLSGSLSSSYMSQAPWESTSQYAYAKYVRLSSNKTFYCYAPSSSALTGEGTISVQYWKTKGTAGADSFWPGVRLVAQTGVSNMYSFTIPSDATGFLINNGNADKSAKAECQTVALYPGTGGDTTRYANGHNMFVVTSNNLSTNQTGVWKDIVYNLGGYWDGNTSGTWKELIMAAPTDDSGNQAELRHVTVSGNAQFKVSMVYQNSAGETIKYWFGHCGTSYTFLDYTQTNTTDGAAGGDGYRNGKFKSSLSSGHNSYSFYFKAGIIYIEDDYNESAAGYLYFANAADPESIKVTATNSASQTIQSNAKITSIDGTESVSNLTFKNGSTNIKGMHKISLYNLRGNDTGKYITSLTISDGTNSQTYTWAAATTGNPSIYIDITSSTQDSSAKGPAASLAFAVSQAITSSANSSVCNVPKATAAILCETYDDLSASAKSSFTSAKITTWNSAKPTYSGSQDVSMNAILYRLNSIYDNGESRGVLAGFNGLLFGNKEDELSTIIIIVASSVALLSVTALSILVIRKRKTKEQ